MKEIFLVAYISTELRHSWRILWRSKAFAIAAIGTLALGMAACTAMFTLVNTVLLKPLPYQEPERLVVIWEQSPQIKAYPQIPLSAHHFLEWQKRSQLFEQIAGFVPTKTTFHSAGHAEELNVLEVSSNFFRTIGITPRIGRGFTNDDQQPGRKNVIISDSFWRRQFAADPSVIGRKIVLNGDLHTVIGVMPAQFAVPQTTALNQFYQPSPQTDIWRPIDIAEAGKHPGSHDLTGLGRLRYGVTLPQATSELESILKALPLDDSQTKFSPRMAPLQSDVVREVRGGLWLLAIAVGAVFLIVCVNISNLLLTRGIARQREFALRSALGASSLQLMSQVLRECTLLAILSGIPGFLIATWLIQLASSAPISLPTVAPVQVDLSAFLFASILSLVTALLFGLIPAWRVRRTDPQDALRSGPATAHLSARSHARNLFIGVQVALSTVLLITAGLMIHSLIRVLSADRGYQADRIFAVDVRLPNSNYWTEQQTSGFYDRAIAQVSALPGVLSSGVISRLPLNGDTSVNSVVTREMASTPAMEKPSVSFRFTSPDYFRAMGIPLIRGRLLQASDWNKPVALITQKMAETLWPGQDPIGKEFYRTRISSDGLRVIGVVGDIRGSRLDQEPGLMSYRYHTFQQLNEATIVVRTAYDSDTISSTLRETIHKMDMAVAVSRIRTMGQIISAAVAQRRFQALILVGFASAALLLACLGIYGVVAYAVRLRTNEIGIRMALGGNAGNVRNLVLRQSMWPVAVGLVAGVIAAAITNQFLSSFLYGVSAHDPFTFGISIIVLSVSALLAGFLPARRATRIDPMEALRY